MKILIITTYFPPVNSIASLRPYSWAKYWTLMGHDVTVLTTEKINNPTTDINFSYTGFKVKEIPFPNYFKFFKNKFLPPTTGSTTPRQTSVFQNYMRQILEFLRRKTGILSHCRMPDMTDLWIKPAIKSIQEEKWDLVVSTAWPYTSHIIAHRLKKNKIAKKWIADYRDTWSNNYIYNGLFPFNRFEKLIEKKIIKAADAVTTVSAPIAQAQQKYLSLPKVHIIENGFDPEDFSKLSHESIFENDGKFRIVYTGTIYQKKRDPSNLFEAIKSIHNDTRHKHLLENLEVIFAGAEQGNLTDLIQKYSVEKWVRYIGFVSREDSLRMQRDAHSLLSLAWNDSKVDGVLTGKLFEYLFSQTPIISIGGKRSEASGRFIEENNIGYVFEKPIEIQEYLVSCLLNIRKRKNKISEDCLNRYTRKQLAENMLNIIKNVNS